MEEPYTAVHLQIMWVAVCHVCGWEGELERVEQDAEREADAHQCQ